MQIAAVAYKQNNLLKKTHAYTMAVASALYVSLRTFGSINYFYISVGKKASYGE